MARRWAVLIDADNVGAKCADPLFHCIADMGDVIVRRVVNPGDKLVHGNGLIA